MPRYNENARAISHSPPWIKSKVQIKNMTGLKSMCAIYGISTATFKYKREYVSALMKYPRMGWTAANRLKDIGLVNKKDKYKRNGRGGQEEWTGTIERLKLSEVWDRSSPSERQCIAEFIADKRGVDWRTFLIRTGDYLNAVQLGLVGPNECRYNVSLTQAINGSPSAQPSASGQLRINAHPSDGRGYLVEE
eukprot:226983_1